MGRFSSNSYGTSKGTTDRIPRIIGDGSFTADDYRKIAKAEQIRNASDYDDFYIASKEETRQQVENALYFVEKVEKFLGKK